MDRPVPFSTQRARARMAPAIRTDAMDQTGESLMETRTWGAALRAPARNTLCSLLLAGLAAAYDDIRQGLGFNKPPHVYGAFPTDPYSHTPSGQGAKQPGMTGQVKEEILTRLGELGVTIADGALAFRPTLLRAQEYTSQASAFHYVNIEGQAEAIELPAFLESIFISPPQRVSGTAVFLSAEKGATPFALLHNLKHNKVLHEQNLFVTVQHHEVPWIGFDRRCEVEPLGHDCWQVVLHFGFKNDPDVPEALKLLEGRGVPLDEMETSYFLSRDTVIPTFGGGMALWREKLFASMHRNAADMADFLNLPSNRIVELGAKVEI